MENQVDQFSLEKYFLEFKMWVKIVKNFLLGQQN